MTTLFDGFSGIKPSSGDSAPPPAAEPQSSPGQPSGGETLAGSDIARMFAPAEFDAITRREDPPEKKAAEPQSDRQQRREAEPEKQQRREAEPEPEPERKGPAAAADEFPEQIPGDPKANAAWGKLRKRVIEAEEQLAKYSAKPDAAQDPGVLKALEEKVAEKEAKLAEYEELLRISQIEETKEYKELVEEPLAAIVVAVEAFAEKYKISEDALLKAFSEQDQTLQDEMLEPLLENFAPRDRNRIYNMLEEAGKLYATDAEIRANSAVAAQELDARKRAAAERQEAELGLALRKANDQVLAVAKDKFSEFGVSVDFDAVRERVDGVRVDQAPPEQQAYAVVAAAVLPTALEAVDKLRQENAKLQQSLQAYLKSSSSTRPAASEPSSAPAASTNPALAAIERFG